MNVCKLLRSVSTYRNAQVLFIIVVFSSTFLKLTKHYHMYVLIGIN